MANRSTYVAPAHTIALILAGGRGSRLYELTDRRSKPAVHFGGNYRLIDFALSNCVNSGIRRIAVATQYKSHSLLRHINQAWSFLQPTVNEFVDLLPAQQRVDENSWYRGTADAVYQNIDILQSYRPFPKYVVILAGDHIYKMNYSVMLSEHIASGAECTVACIEVPRNDAKGFGVMAVDKTGKIIRFVEKPADPPPMPGNPDKSLCSMGIYIFNADYLFDALVRDMHKENTSHDFGKDIIPEAVAKGVAMSHAFSGSCVHGVGEPDNQEDYWRDVGTIESFWEANIDLTHTVPKLNLYDSAWPIWTAQPQLPPAKFVHNEGDRRGIAIESIVTNGCLISGELYHSIIGSGCRIHSHAKVHWTVLAPRVVVGPGAYLNRCIVDSGVVIPSGMVIGVDANEDARHFRRSPTGITLVTRDMMMALENNR